MSELAVSLSAPTRSHQGVHSVFTLDFFRVLTPSEENSSDPNAGLALLG